MYYDNMDPFDVLGIKPTHDFNVIRNAYKKMLIATHPDKMGGNAKYFMMVHEAYQYLENTNNHKKKERKAPDVKQNYSTNIPNVQKPVQVSKNMSSSQFNSFFNENKINDLNPFNQGYSSYMHASSKVRDDESDLHKHKVKNKKQELILYKEPEAMNSPWAENFVELGQTNINDFSCRQGTDYLKAHSEPQQVIDTVKRYKNIEHLQQERENANFKMTADELRYKKDKEKHSLQLEEYRRRMYQSSLQNIESNYNTLNNRLTFRN